MVVNFRSFPPDSRGCFVMVQLAAGSTLFSPICADRQTARDLFTAAMSNPAVAGASLIERDRGGEYELAAYAHAGIAEHEGIESGWRIAMAEATAAFEWRTRREIEEEELATAERDCIADYDNGPGYRARHS